VQLRAQNALPQKITGTAAVTQRTRPQSRRDGYCCHSLNAVRLPKV